MLDPKPKVSMMLSWSDFRDQIQGTNCIIQKAVIKYVFLAMHDFKYVLFGNRT